MAKKNKPVVVELDEVKNVVEMLAAMNVGHTLELKHHRSKEIAKTLRSNGVTLTTPTDHIRTFNVGEAAYQWTNRTYASAAKAGDVSKAQRTIVRTS
jgi:hypothetical protein